MQAMKFKRLDAEHNSYKNQLFQQYTTLQI
jgi:hypothetical protein